MRGVNALICALVCVVFAVVPLSICAAIPILLLLGAFGLGIARGNPEGMETPSASLTVAVATSAMLGALVNLFIMFLIHT